MQTQTNRGRFAATQRRTKLNSRLSAVGLALVGGLALGCASLESVTSGHIGCSATDITIIDDSPGWNTRSWTAECHGKLYYCFGTSGNSSQISCKPAEDDDSEAVAAPVQPAGCQYDTQCKGDRICRERACVEP
jgi:hypothetical protein